MSARAVARLLTLGEQKSAEERLIRQGSEVRVLPGRDTIAWLDFDRPAKAVVRAVDVAGKCLRYRERVMNMIGGWGDLKPLFQMRLRFRQIARVDERDAVVVIIFRGTKGHGGLLQPPVAHGDVQIG